MTFYTEVLSMISMAKFILIWFWWAFILIWLIGAKIKWGKYPIDVVIIEKRGNNLIKTNDRGGRFKDPYTKLFVYKLLKAKDTIQIPNYDHVLHNVSQSTTFFERIVNLIRGNAGTIFLFRYGSKQYKPIKVGTNGELKWQELKNKNGESIWINRYEIVDPRKQLGALDFEVVDWDNMNQMVQEWQATQERRKTKSEFWKAIVIPAIMIGAAVIISIVMIKLSADWRPPATTQTTPEPATKPNIPIASDLIP